MTIQYEELANSPVLDLGVSHSRAKREFKVQWSEVLNLVADIFPPASGTITATFPGFPYLYANGIHIEPFSGEKTKPIFPTDLSDLTHATLNQYDFAKVSIDYETPAYNDDSSGDPVSLLTHRLTIGGEFLTIEAAGLEWCNGDVVSPETTAGVLIPTVEHQITWPRVLNPPFETIRDRLGSVNDYEMSFKTGRIFRETLLFLGAELNRDIKTDGSLAWEVSYRFSEKRVKARGNPEPAEDCETPDTEGECTDAGGIWDSDSPQCNDFVGGWNHYFRSAGRSSGFYRLQIKPELDPDSPTCLATPSLLRCKPTHIYKLRSFDALFIEDL